MRLACVLAAVALALTPSLARPANWLSQPLNPTFIGSDFLIAPDGQNVFFRATPTGGVANLFEVPLNGGPITQLTSDVPFSQFDGMSLTHNAADLLYLRNKDLYDLDLATSQTSRLTSTANVGWISSFIAPDDSRTVISVNGSIINTNALYTVPVSGGPLLRIVKSNFVLAGNVQFTDDRHFLYLATEELSNKFQLFRSSVDEANSVRINTTSGNFGAFNTYKVSPDQQRAFYTANGGGTSLPFRLYSVPVTGGTEDLLTPGAITGEIKNFWFGGVDNSRVIYTGNNRDLTQVELYSMPISGGTPISISGALPAGQSIGNVVPISDPHTGQVAFMADDQAHFTSYLYLTSATQNQRRSIDQISTVNIGSSPPFTTAFDPEGKYLFVRREFNGPLYAYKIATGARTVVGSGVEQFLFMPDGQHILFTDYVFGDEFLYMSLLDGSQRQLLSNDDYAFDEDISWFSLAPDGQTVVYLRGQTTAFAHRLYSVLVPEPTLVPLVLLGLFARRRHPKCMPRNSRLLRPPAPSHR